MRREARKNAGVAWIHTVAHTFPSASRASAPSRARRASVNTPAAAEGDRRITRRFQPGKKELHV